MTIHEIFHEFKNETVYYKPNPGNGGDAIIAHATYTLLKKNEVNFKLIKGDENLNNKIVLFGGGGNLNSKYSDCANFIRLYHNKVKKLILLPHTVSGHEDLLKSLNNNVYIICREFTSFNYVKSFNNVNTLLFDDLAFNLDLKQDIHFIKNANRLMYLTKKRTIISNIKNGRRTLAFFLSSRDHSRKLNAFREDAEKLNIKVPENNIDISEIINLDYSMLDQSKVAKTTSFIFTFLNQFEEVCTNRLHVCIAAALLGKIVYFYGNSYWKNQSVYEFSIIGKYPNVKWMGYDFR